MSSSVMTEAILTIAVVIAASTVAAVFLSNTSILNDVLGSTEQSTKDALATQIEVDFATNSSNNQATIWVMNTGQSSIASSEIRSFGVFFGPSGNFSMILYNVSTLPSWNFTIINGANTQPAFIPSSTLEITIQLPYNLTSGDYFVRVVTNNGISSDYYFSI